LSHGTRLKSSSSVAIVFIPCCLHVNAIIASAGIRPYSSMYWTISSGSAVSGSVVKSLSTGRTSFLTKPMSLSSLLASSSLILLELSLVASLR